MKKKLIALALVLAAITPIIIAQQYERFVNIYKDGSIISRYIVSDIDSINFSKLQIFEVGAEASTTEGGIVTINGGTDSFTIYENDEITLSAEAAVGYNFINWTVGGEEVSTENPYTFAANQSATYVANFQERPYCTYTGNMGHGSRNLNSFTISDGTNTVAVSGIQPTTSSPVYVDKTTSVLETTAGATLSFSSLNWNGEWMHGYVYVDYNKDREFNQTLNADGTTGGELVSYSCYNKANSKGESVYDGAGVTTETMPTWIIPADIKGGDYRLRFKIDWDSTDPCGQISGGNITSKNGGCICDIIVRIPTAIYTVAVSSNDSTMGSVEASASQVSDGETVVLTATAAEGYQFVNWTVGGEEVSTENPFTAVVSSNSEYVANFEPIIQQMAKVYVNTPGGVEITSKEIWTENCEIIIVDEQGNESLNMITEFRGRGNSTWAYPKKPYAIKLDSKAEVLGMPKHKRWVLLANWMDRTLMRNAVSFEIARKLMDWAPRGKFVEFYMNGEHQGNYYLCEQIKMDKNRVNVTEFEEADGTGEEGAYLLEFDTNYQAEINYFYSYLNRYPVTIKDPDEEFITSWSHPYYTYIQEFVKGVEIAASANNYETLFSKIDMATFIDYFLVYELTTNSEPSHPKSVYMYKDAGADAKIKAGPVWDFDWGTFNPNKSGWQNRGAVWYPSLFKSQDFLKALRARWNEIKPEMETISSFIDEQANFIRDSEAVNHEMWPIDNRHNYPNGDELMTFDQAVSRMKQAYQNRIAEIDELIAALPISEVYTVSVTSSDATKGSATVSATEVASGDKATLTATAAAGYKFVNWTLNGEVISMKNPYTATITANSEFVANFQEGVEDDLKVTIESAFASKDHYEIWGESYPVSNVIDGDYDSKYWSDGPQEIGNIVSVTLSEECEAGEITIYFASSDQPSRAKIEVSTDNTIWNSVATFTQGDIVMEDGYYYYTCNASGERAKYVRLYITSGTQSWLQVVEFEVSKLSVEIAERTITVQSADASQGTAYIGTEGETQKTSTSLVEITAQPAAGYKFANWTLSGEVVSTANPYSDKTEGNKTYTANFEPLARYTLSVSSADSQMGSVTASLTGEQLEGTEITLRATPNQGYQFVNWTVAGEIVSIENPCVVTLSENCEYVANFAVRPPSLPKVYVNTPGGVAITSKDIWTEGCSIMIEDSVGAVVLDGITEFRGRGNSTWAYPKKPYAIKLDSKAEVLGMPKHKRWVLLANWMDRTLLRNAVSFEMARNMMDWAPRGTFVEFYLNGEHQGNYYLCEQIKIDKNRLNITEFEEADGTGEEGGYLLEFDTNYQAEINYFFTSSNRYPVTIKDPDEDFITTWSHPYYTYIQDFVNVADNAASIYNNETLLSKIDLGTFVDYFLIYEMTTNSEPTHPKSCYMYKDAGADSKLHAGPVWDFDWGTFNPNTTGFLNNNALWYSSLFRSSEFITALKARWAEVKPMLQGLNTFVDEQAELIRESEAVNHEMWPIDSRHNYPNGDELMTFDQAVARLKQGITNRINELDRLINNLQ